jgi:protein-tyrosine phosphatase
MRQHIPNRLGPRRVYRALLRRSRAIGVSLLEARAPDLPQPEPMRAERRVLFVCHGNLCRSAMAQAITRIKLAEAGALGRIAVDSAGTSGAATGKRADPRARRTLLRHGARIGDFRARAFADSDFESFDLILAMEGKNREDVLSRAQSRQDAEKVRLLLDYVDGGDIPDPVDGKLDDFERAYETIERGCEALVARLLSDMDQPAATKLEHSQ